MNQESMQIESEPSAIINPHARSDKQILTDLSAKATGLASAEVLRRQQLYGPNALPKKDLPGLLEVFLNQFKSPLIYVLVAAAGVSLVIQEFSDAIFIGAVQLAKTKMARTRRAISKNVM